MATARHFAGLMTAAGPMRAVSIRRRPQAERLAPEESGFLLVDPDELDQVFDSEVGESLHAIFAHAIDPDDAVLDLEGVQFQGSSSSCR